MRETWYVLADDSVVHPNEVALNDKGVLTHKNGAVVMRGDVPSTRGVEVDEKTGKRVYDGPHDHLHKDWPGADGKPKADKPKADDDGKAHGHTKESKPDADKADYKTRDAKAK